MMPYAGWSMNPSIQPVPVVQIPNAPLMQINGASGWPMEPAIQPIPAVQNAPFIPNIGQDWSMNQPFQPIPRIHYEPLNPINGAAAFTVMQTTTTSYNGGNGGSNPFQELYVDPAVQRTGAPVMPCQCPTCSQCCAVRETVQTEFTMAFGSVIPECPDAMHSSQLVQIVPVAQQYFGIQEPTMDLPVEMSGPRVADSPRPAGRFFRRKPFCTFCKSNGETAKYYTQHILKDPNGSIVCPILRRYICPNCGATGTNAHTLRYCPQRQSNQTDGPSGGNGQDVPFNGRYLRNASGGCTRWRY